MIIVALVAENIKKLTAVSIRPDGALVQITGKNGHGKTSVLDSIWWALEGTRHIQSVPIRKGENEAHIQLDLGEIIVTRKFKAAKKEGGETTTSLVVENKEGARFSSPQKMLDDLLGKLTFDPLAFQRMEPKKQFDTLKDFVPGVDFDAIAGKNKADYEKRTEINRRAKESRAAAEAIPRISGDLEPVDEGHLITQLENVAAHNHDIEVRKENRANMFAEIKKRRARAEELLKEAEALAFESAALQKKLTDVAPLPEPQDAEAIRAKIDSAKDTNRQIDEHARRAEFEKVAADLEAHAGTLTLAIDKRDAEKEKAIKAVELPVPDVTFGDGEILMAGMPLDQASDAEQLRASIGIAMALNPKLRVIRVRDGSLLDEDSMKLIEEMANGKGYQVWIERVDSSGKMGFVLEDGHLKGAP